MDLLIFWPQIGVNGAPGAGRVQQFPFGLQPVVQIPPVLGAPCQEQFVRPTRNRLSDRIAARRLCVGTSS